MNAAFATYQKRFGEDRLPPMDVDYRAEIAHYPVWVVESGGIIVAGLIMVFTDDDASIANIAVSPQHQGRGIGGALMRLAEGAAVQRGYHELKLATHELLDENLSLYRHLGWQESGRESPRVFFKKPV